MFIRLLSIISVVQLSCSGSTKAPVVVKGSKGTQLTTDSRSTVKPGAEFNQWQRPSMISAHDLHDQNFMPLRISVALQPLLNSQTPVLQYAKPKLADFVKIIRCQSRAVIAGAFDSVSLKDLAMSGATLEKKAEIYQNNDYFNAAISNPLCEVLTPLGIVEESFYDTWAPTGSFFYMISACVHPDRLEKNSVLDSTDCSKQIAISNELKDYTNKRLDAEKIALRKVEDIGIEMEMIIRKLKLKALDYGEAIDDCATREFERAVFKKKRDAIVKLIAIGFDVMLEFKSNGGVRESFQMYAKPHKNILASNQIVGSVGAYTFGGMFQELTTAQQDLPRTCEKGISMSEEVRALLLEFQRKDDIRITYSCRAAHLSQGLDEKTPLPEGCETEVVDPNAAPEPAVPG